MKSKVKKHPDESPTIVPDEALEIQAIETPESEMGNLLVTEDMETKVSRLERLAELVPRYERAIRQILIACTTPSDWHVFGEGDQAKVCLTSAGAERIAKHFSIIFSDVSYKKELFTDANGKGYRYIYEGKARLGDSIVHAIGTYGTRDKFLGYANGQWRPVEAINEGHIQNAAYHVFVGNAIKTLLGLRNLSFNEYKELMQVAGKNAATTGQHSYATGSQGGTAADDHDKQKELAELCINLARAGLTVVCENGDCTTMAYEGPEDYDEIKLASEICCTLSAFKGRNGWVQGKPASKLHGKRLDIALQKARECVKEAGI